MPSLKITPVKNISVVRHCKVSYKITCKTWDAQSEGHKLCSTASTLCTLQRVGYKAVVLANIVSLKKTLIENQIKLCTLQRVGYKDVVLAHIVSKTNPRKRILKKRLSQVPMLNPLHICCFCYQCWV